MGETTNVGGRGEAGPREDEKRLPPEIVRCLDVYRARARRFATVKGLAVTITVYVCIVIAAALLDRFVRMPVWLRAMLTFGSFSGIVAFAYYVFVVPVFRRRGARETALDLERDDPDFNEALVTSVDHLATSGMPRGASPALVSEVAKGSASVAGGLEISRVLPRRLIKRILIVAIAALAVFAALFAVPGLGFARLVARFHAPLANMPRASLIEIEVEPGSVVVGTGDPIEIGARLEGVAREAVLGPVVLHVRPKGESWTESEMAASSGQRRRPDQAKTEKSGAPGREADEPEVGEQEGEPQEAQAQEADVQRVPAQTPGARLATQQSSSLRSTSRGPKSLRRAKARRPEFVRKIETVTCTFDYYVTAGDAESAMYRIVAVDRPLPELFRVTYDPPVYTGAVALTQEGPTGAVRGLKGSRVTLSVKPSVPVRKASLVKDGSSIPMEISEDGMLSTCEFDLEKDGAYTLRLEGEHGLSNREGREYPMRALDDRPPRVDAGLVRATSRVDPEGALCIRYDARDDWGVEETRYFVSLNGGEAAPNELPLARPGRRIASDFLVDLKLLHAKKGDHVSIVVAARDALDQVGRSRAIMIWLGRDVAARRAAERAMRIKSAAEAVRDMARLREVLENDRRKLAELMRQDGWSAERERKLAQVRRLERQLQTKAEEARAELQAARELSEDELARALSVASRKLLRERAASERLDETLARLDTAEGALRDRAVRALEEATERVPKDQKLSQALEKISTGERSTAALEQDGALAERRERLDEIAARTGKEQMTPAREQFVRREEELMAEERQELAEDAKELSLNVAQAQWKDRARELAEEGRRAAEELAGQDDMAEQIAALAEEAKELAQAELADAQAVPLDAELQAIRAEMDDLQAELAEAARDQDALGRPDFALARDEDLTRAALEGIERRNIEEAAPQVGARDAAERLAEELGEAAEAREALGEAARERRGEALARERRERPDEKALEVAEREAEDARDTLTRLAGDPAEALERLAVREEGVAEDAAEAAQQAEQQAEAQPDDRQAGEEAAGREELAELAETQAHLATEAARLAERLMHEANAQTAAAQPDTQHIEALDDLRQGLEELVEGDMNAAAEALQEAALGDQAAAEEAAGLGDEAAQELARLANEARRMAEAQAAREAGEQAAGDETPGEKTPGEDTPGEQAPADPALAELGQLAGLEAEQRELAGRTRESDARNAAEGEELAREQEALGERTREAMEAMRAQDQALEAARDAAANAAERAEELAEAADALAQELGRPGDAAAAEPEAGNVEQGAEELARDVGRAQQAVQAAAPQAAPQMEAAAEATGQAAQEAQAGHQATQENQPQPAAGQFAEAAENLHDAAENLAQAAAAAEAGLTPEAEAAMQTATGEQAAAQQALARAEQAARTQAHGNQVAAADALAEARRETAQAMNSARMAQAAAMQAAQAQSQRAQQSQAMSASGTPGGSERQSDGRVLGRAPQDEGGDWGRLQEAEDAAKFAEREGITAHYADAIRLYFEAVAREGRRE